MHVCGTYVTPWVLRSQQLEVRSIYGFVQPKTWPIVACSVCWIELI